MTIRGQRSAKARPREPRAQLSLVARYRSPVEEEFREDRTHDLSSNGMFIATPDPAPRSTLLKIECVGEDGESMRAVARVAWSRRDSSEERPSGMGIKFIRVDEDSTQALARALEGATEWADEPAQAQPAGEGPTQGQPDGEAPAQAQPATEALTQAQPAGEGPTQGQPAGEAPAEDRSATQARESSQLEPAAEPPQPVPEASRPDAQAPPAEQLPAARAVHAQASAGAEPRVGADASPEEEGEAIALPMRTPSARRGLIALAIAAVPVGLWALANTGEPAAPASQPAQSPAPSQASAQVTAEPAAAVAPTAEAVAEESPAAEAASAPRPAPAEAPVQPADGPPAGAAPTGEAVVPPAEVPAAAAAESPAAEPAMGAPAAEPASVAPAVDEYRLRVVTTPTGALVTMDGKQQRAPFSVKLTRAQLEQPIEVHAELEGHRATKGEVTLESFEMVKGIPRETLYLKLRPRARPAAAASTDPSDGSALPAVEATP